MSTSGNSKIWCGRYCDMSMGALLCGVGPEAAERSLNGLLDNISCRRIVVVGTCAALSSETACGIVEVAGSVRSEWREGLKIELPEVDLEIFHDTGLALEISDYLTINKPLKDSLDAAKLKNKYNVQCVDMESWVIADYFAAQSVPVYIVKAISDHADENMKSEFDEWVELAADNSARAALALAEHLNKI